MNPTNYTPITPQEAYAWLKSGEAIMIDVREPDEYKAEHIGYAASLPLNAVGDISSYAEFSAGRKIIFQCLRGKRGEQACLLLGTNGEGKSYYNLTGGIDAWKEAGLPVIRGMGAAGISIFRQVQMAVGTLIILCIALGFSGLILGFILAGIFGAALLFAGLSGWCGLALLLSKMPWNK